jgi:hypothetical protein
MSAPEIVLLIGDINLLHHRDLAAEDVVTLITLPHPDGTSEPHNTIMLSFDRIGEVPVETRTIDGKHRLTSRLNGMAVLNGLRLGTAISGMIERLEGSSQPASHTPLFCATRHDDDWHVYSRAHLSADRWCFIRTSATAVQATPDDLNWLPRAITGQALHAGVLNTHQCTVPPGFAGKEVETKFTLPTDAPTWSLAIDAHHQLTTGGIPAMTPRFGQDFEMCDYANYLFHVAAPPEQAGYVSFMSVRPNRFWIKRKHFAVDSLVRSESVSSEIEIREPLDSYVHDVLHLDATLLPPFRRIRYDIMFESLATGNHYCVLFDRCTVYDDPDEMLVQCEIEYMRSRRVLPLTEDLVLDELDELTEWAADFLADHGITAQTHYYSKLSFLRDTVRRRPELAYSSRRDRAWVDRSPSERYSKI